MPPSPVALSEDEDEDALDPALLAFLDALARAHAAEDYAAATTKEIP